jgi:hypothetical protein
MLPHEHMVIVVCRYEIRLCKFIFISRKFASITAIKRMEKTIGAVIVDAGSTAAADRMMLYTKRRCKEYL